MLNKRLRYLLIFLTALGVGTIHHVQKHIFRPQLQSLVFYDPDIYIDARDPEVSCRFPIIHPFHSSILQHVSVAEPIRCFERSYLLTMVDSNGYLVYNKSALDESGYGKSSFFPIRCIYEEISRPDGDDFNVVYGPEIEMTGHDYLNSDFVYVQCKNFAGVNIYANFHAYVKRVESVMKFQDDTELGVAILGIDSMSRLNFMRQLSRTFKYMTEDLNATVMLGFNKVGENTFPNVIPMLTGYPAPASNYESFVDWPFIWKYFKEAGAATMYAEDMPNINMFNYLTTGIPEQPTHHYMRTFWLAVENSIFYKLSSTYCLGLIPKHVIFFEYLKSFLRVYRDSPLLLFSLFNEVSHDYVNTVGAIDTDFYNFIRSSFEENLFNRTVTIILGDHGNRIDKIRNTDVGRIEDMMPMVSVILPPWVDKVYPHWRTNLHANSIKLVSTYDLHVTLMDVLSTIKNSDKVNKDITRSTKMSDRLKKHFGGAKIGVSLLKDIPKSRNCHDVGVPDWFCVCQSNEKQLNENDPRSIAAAESVLKYFNKVILNGLTDCAVQKLHSVERVTLKTVNDKEKKILVRFRTLPGDGIFEAMVDNDSFKVSGDIFRINRYGNQADCLSESLRSKSTLLRGVCYCLT